LPTIAIVGLDEVQVAEDVMLSVDASEYVPVAVNCMAPVSCIVTLPGVIAMDTSDTAGVVTERSAYSLTPPNVAVILHDPTATPVASPLLSTVA
jgi:hypothetical protein